MRNRDLINLEEAYASIYEAAYVPRKTSVGNIHRVSDPTKIEGRTKESTAKLSENFEKLQNDRNDLEAATEIVNLLNQLDQETYEVTIGGKTQTLTGDEVLQKILDETQTPEHDYTLMQSQDIMTFKRQGGDEGFYHLYKKIFAILGKKAREYTRREVATDSVVIYYIGSDGQPYRTSVKVPPSGKINGSFWKTMRFNGHSAPPPRPFNRYNPYELQGRTVDEIKDAVGHSDAAKAFELKYPPLDYPKLYTKR